MISISLLPSASLASNISSECQICQYLSEKFTCFFQVLSIRSSLLLIYSAYGIRRRNPRGTADYFVWSFFRRVQIWLPPILENPFAFQSSIIFFLFSLDHFWLVEIPLISIVGNKLHHSQYRTVSTHSSLYTVSISSLQFLYGLVFHFSSVKGLLSKLTLKILLYK